MDEQTHTALRNYVAELFAQEDAGMKNILIEANKAEMPAINLQDFEGRLLQFLAELLNAKTIVEIGTLAGYSGAWLARALPEDGKLFTLELEEKHAKIAQANFEALGLNKKVEILLGNARENLASLSKHTPFDMVFIDADKDNYHVYLEWAIENLRQGGLIAAHNALRHGRVLAPEDEMDKAIIAYNKRIAEDKRLSSFIIGIGDGMAVSIKK